MSEQRETGWHMHEDVVMNDRSCIGLHSARDHHLERVLVVPVGEARETIARAMDEHYGWPTGTTSVGHHFPTMSCRCGVDCSGTPNARHAHRTHVANQILAALAAPAPSGALHEEAKGRG